MVGCTNNPPLKTNPTLPKVKEVRAISDRNAIALEWDIVNKPEVLGYYIKRSQDAKKYKLVAKINNKYVSHWSDKNLKPDTVYYYKVSTFTKNGIPSFAKLKQVKTIKTISPVIILSKTSEIKAKGMIKVIFRPHHNERVKGYYVERFDDKNGKWEQILNITPRLSAEFIDTNLIDGKRYKYRIIAYTFDNLKSYPSKELSIQTLQKPKIITNIVATTNLAKKIELKWQQIPNVKEYIILYSNTANGSYTKLATTKTNHYIDTINKDNYKRYYKIYSIDKYNVESLKSQAVMGSTLNVPAEPIVSIDRGKNSIKFMLSSSDKRAVKYLIKKKDGEKVTKIHNVKTEYIDKKIKSKKTYKYEIYTIDKNGLVSKPAKVEVSF